MFEGEPELCNIEFAIYLYNLWSKKVGCCDDCSEDDADLRVELELCPIVCSDANLPTGCTEGKYYQPLELLAVHVSSDPNLIIKETLIRESAEGPDIQDLQTIADNLRKYQNDLNKKMVPCFQQETIPCPPPICISPWKIEKRLECDPCKGDYY